MNVFCNFCLLLGKSGDNRRDGDFQDDDFEEGVSDQDKGHPRERQDNRRPHPRRDRHGRDRERRDRRGRRDEKVRKVFRHVNIITGCHGLSTHVSIDNFILTP